MRLCSVNLELGCFGDSVGIWHIEKKFHFDASLIFSSFLQQAGDEGMILGNEGYSVYKR